MLEIIGTNHELVELRVARLVPVGRARVQLRRHGRQLLQHVRRRADLIRITNASFHRAYNKRIEITRRIDLILLVKVK
jgi:hypothetical protein